VAGSFRCSTKWEPMKPQAPVTMIFIRCIPSGRRRRQQHPAVSGTRATADRGTAADFLGHQKLALSRAGHELGALVEEGAIPLLRLDALRVKLRLNYFGGETFGQQDRE
jgi:hypothetical protein